MVSAPDTAGKTCEILRELAVTDDYGHKKRTFFIKKLTGTMGKTPTSHALGRTLRSAARGKWRRKRWNFWGLLVRLRISRWQSWSLLVRSKTFQLSLLNGLAAYVIAQWHMVASADARGDAGGVNSLRTKSRACLEMSSLAELGILRSVAQKALSRSV